MPPLGVDAGAGTLLVSLVLEPFPVVDVIDVSVSKVEGVGGANETEIAGGVVLGRRVSDGGTSIGVGGGTVGDSGGGVAGPVGSGGGGGSLTTGVIKGTGDSIEVSSAMGGGDFVVDMPGLDVTFGLEFVAVGATELKPPSPPVAVLDALDDEVPLAEEALSDIATAA